MNVKRMIVTVVAAFIMLSGCSKEEQPQPSPATVPPSSSISPTPSEPVDNPSDKQYELSFTDNKLAVPLEQMTFQQTQSIFSSETVEDAVIHLYRNSDDPALVFAALELKSITYAIGEIGYLESQTAEDFTIEQVEAFDQSFIKLAGACGANCPITYYLSTRDTPPTLLRFDAHTVEADADGEGTKEIIATVGTAAQTTIYMLRNEAIAGALLNELLDATAVLYNPETNRFQAEMPGGKATTFKLSDERLQIVP
jgi:hypothetical protein